MPRYEFEGRVAIVTGGTSGIGLATARVLAEAGACVVIAGRNAVRGAKALAELSDAGEVHFVATDVADPKQVDALVGYTTREFGGLDLAVNNAGIGRQVPLLEADPSVWHDTIAINLTGVYHCLRAEIRAMLLDPERARRACIVNMSSMAGRVAGIPGIAAYVASKGGVDALTRAVALELASTGVRVNAISPATIETPILDNLAPETLKAMIQAYPVGRVGQPMEIARAVAWLCSDECRFMTGHNMVIDGGYTLQ